jgi:cytochrome P450
LQGVLRVANADLQIGGKRIWRGQSVVIWLAAANRDPVEFPEPDRFDIARENTRHLAFGHGAHRCLGAALALPMIGAALEALLERAPRLQLVECGGWQGNFLFRSRASLLARVESAKSG